ncbi:MAG: hypothetical protein LH606_20715 [Cytophagaceae bacterium]|nr:hypothetical protein [Cytophagaceae bacterium]
MKFLLINFFVFIGIESYCQENTNFCSTPNSKVKSFPKTEQDFQTSELNPCPLTTYQVRVFFHFVRGTSNPGYNASHIPAILGNLNSAYSQFGITFISAGDREWTEEIFGSPSADISAFGGIFTYSGSDPRSNAINLYILPANSPVQGGKANNIPSNALFVAGTRTVRFNCIDTYYPVPLTRVIAHEVGHCLGLNHTYDEVTGDGDGLSDTSLDKSTSESCITPAPDCVFVGKQSGDCNTCPNPTNPTSIIKNVMAGNLPDCMSEFSPMQLAIMRQNLAGQLNYVVQSTSVVPSEPNLQNMTYGTQGGGTNNIVYTVNLVNANTWYMIKTNLNGSDLVSPVSWNHPGGINAFAGGSNNVE